MSRLRTVSSASFDDLLNAAPGALEADRDMRRLISEELTPRMRSLIGLAVAGCLRCERFVDDLRGPLDKSFASQAASDWRASHLQRRIGRCSVIWKRAQSTRRQCADGMSRSCGGGSQR